MERTISSADERHLSDRTHLPILESTEPNNDACLTTTISDAVESENTSSKTLNPGAEEFVPSGTAGSVENGSDPSAKAPAANKQWNTAPKVKGFAPADFCIDSREPVAKSGAQNQNLPSLTLSPHANEFIPGESNQNHRATTAGLDHFTEGFDTSGAAQSHSLSSMAFNADADEFIPSEAIFFGASRNPSHEQKGNLEEKRVVAEQLQNGAKNEVQVLSKGSISHSKGPLGKELNANATEFVPSTTLNVQGQTEGLAALDPKPEEFVPHKPSSVHERRPEHAAVQKAKRQHHAAKGTGEVAILAGQETELELKSKRTTPSKGDAFTACEGYGRGDLDRAQATDPGQELGEVQTTPSGVNQADGWEDSEDVKPGAWPDCGSPCNSLTTRDGAWNDDVPQVEKWSCTAERNDEEEELRGESSEWRLEATKDERASGLAKREVSEQDGTSGALERVTSRIASNDLDSEREQAPCRMAADEKRGRKGGFGSRKKSKAQRDRCWESLRKGVPPGIRRDDGARRMQKNADHVGGVLSDGRKRAQRDGDEGGACTTASEATGQCSGGAGSEKWSERDGSFGERNRAATKKNKTKKKDYSRSDEAGLGCGGREHSFSRVEESKVGGWDVTKDEADDEDGWKGNEEVWATFSEESRRRLESDDVAGVDEDKVNKTGKEHTTTRGATSDRRGRKSLGEGWTESKQDERKWRKSTKGTFGTANKRKTQKSSKEGRSSRAHGAKEVARTASDGRDKKGGGWNESGWEGADGAAEVDDGAKWDSGESGRADGGSEWGCGTEKREKWAKDEVDGREARKKGKDGQDCAEGGTELEHMAPNDLLRYSLDEIRHLRAAQRRRAEQRQRKSAATGARLKRAHRAELRVDVRDERQEREVQQQIRANRMREHLADTGWEHAVMHSAGGSRALHPRGDA